MYVKPNALDHGQGFPGFNRGPESEALIQAEGGISGVDAHDRRSNPRAQAVAVLNWFDELRRQTKSDR